MCFNEPFKALHSADRTCQKHDYADFFGRVGGVCPNPPNSPPKLRACVSMLLLPSLYLQFFCLLAYVLFLYYCIYNTLFTYKEILGRLII